MQKRGTISYRPLLLTSKKDQNKSLLLCCHTCSPRNTLELKPSPTPSTFSHNQQTPPPGSKQIQPCGLDPTHIFHFHLSHTFHSFTSPSSSSIHPSNQPTRVSFTPKTQKAASYHLPLDLQTQTTMNSHIILTKHSHNNRSRFLTCKSWLFRKVYSSKHA